MFILATPAFAFIAFAPLPPAQRSVQQRAVAQPQMVVTEPGFMAQNAANAFMANAPLPVIEATTQVLAKSEADEVLDELFTAFPIAFTGLVLGGFVLVTSKDTIKSLLPENLDIPDAALLVVLPLSSIGLVVLAKTGVIGGAAGILAKAALDAWNTFAQVALPGALLKY